MNTGLTVAEEIKIEFDREKLALLLFSTRERKRNLDWWEKLSYHRKLYWYRLADAIISQKDKLLRIKNAK